MGGWPGPGRAEMGQGWVREAGRAGIGRGGLGSVARGVSERRGVTAVMACIHIVSRRGGGGHA